MGVVKRSGLNHGPARGEDAFRGAARMPNAGPQGLIGRSPVGTTVPIRKVVFTAVLEPTSERGGV